MYFLSQIMGFRGYLKVTICGNFEYPKIASVEGFELFSCLLFRASVGQLSLEYS